MGAPKKAERYTHVSFRFSKDDLELVERLAKKRKLSKTQIIREGLKALQASA
jgi:hypothetical protein